MVDSPVTQLVLRLVVLAITLLVVVVGLTGPTETTSNLAPYAFSITFWVGLVPASLLLGPVWRYINPLRTIHAGLSRITGPAPAEDRVARGDAFEVVSTLWARLSPFGRRDDGRLVARNPLDGVDGLRAQTGLAGVVVALLGITASDGVSRTQWWQSGRGIEGGVATLGPTLFAHSLVPIALGYHVAHYFSLLLLDGQLTWILASDPFQTGAD